MSGPATPPPVYGPRPYDITSHDHRGIALTISVLFLVYAVMVVSMRIATKYRHMGVDDWITIGAISVAVIQFVMVIVASLRGFGESYALVAPGNIDSIASLLRASDVFLLLALFVAKASVIWLCRRLFAVGQHERHLLCEIMIGISAIWCVGSLLGANVGCTATEVIRAHGQTCSGLVTRWTVIGTVDAVTEVLIFVISVIVIFPLRMTWSKKLTASFCFMLRLPIIVFIGFHVKFLSDFSTAANPAVSLTRPIMFRAAQLLFSLLSASIPTLNQYLRKFDTKQAAMFGYTPGEYGSGHGSYPMTSLNPNESRNRDAKMGTRNGNGEDMGSGNFSGSNHAQYHATVEGPQHGVRDDGVSNASHEEGSIGRQNSEDYIIRKDVRYEVRHED